LRMECTIEDQFGSNLPKEVPPKCTCELWVPT
jgi:hypothetical protein